MLFSENEYRPAPMRAGADEVMGDTATLRHYLDRIRCEPRDPSGSEVLAMIDGLLQLIERRDHMDLLRYRASNAAAGSNDAQT